MISLSGKRWSLWVFPKTQTIVVWVLGEKEDRGYVLRYDGKHPPDKEGDPSRAFLAREGVENMKLLLNGRVRVWRRDGTVISFAVPVAGGIGLISANGTLKK